MREGIIEYILQHRKKGYSDGIPDEVPIRLAQLGKAPSYKQICSAILRNDTTLKTLGYEKRKSKYYDILKKIEFKKRGVIIQLTLF